jgi:hypothetical protein
MKTVFLPLLVFALFWHDHAHSASLPVKVSDTNPPILVDQNAPGINSLWVNLICIRPVEGRPDVSLLDGTPVIWRVLESCM